MRLIGDWDRLIEFLATFQSRFEQNRRIALAQIGELIESTAVEHLQKQDLEWEPLNPRYLVYKVRHGYSEKILIRTATLFRAITSYVEDEKVFVGVKRGVKRERSGEDVVDIAMFLETGTERMPARPLWLPTYRELYDEILKKLESAVSRTVEEIRW